MKAQFALFEVFISFIVMLTIFSVVAEYYYIVSLASYQKNIDYSNLYYDFFNALYKNKTLQNCTYNLDRNCIMLLKDFGNVYNVNLRFSINQNTIETSNFNNCTLFNSECMPITNINTPSYKEACLSICSNSSE